MKDKCFANLLDLVRLVRKENERQLEKWGIQDKIPFEWLAYATEEHGEMAQAICEYIYRNGPAENIVKEAIQAATLCLKIAEMYLPTPTQEGGES